MANSEREKAGEEQGGGTGGGGEEDSRKQLVLFVTVVSARGLAAANKGGGARDLASSLLAKATASASPFKEKEKEDGVNKATHSANPYVRLSYGDIKKQTSVTKKSLLPSWNESFIFPFEDFCNFKMTVYNKVAFGRDEVVGESYLKMPSSQHPVARWYSLKMRNRTVLDLGRRMVEDRGGGAGGEDRSIGQLFLAALLLDPLELTQIGQGLMDLPHAGGINSSADSLSAAGLDTTQPSPSSSKRRVVLMDPVDAAATSPSPSPSSASVAKRRQSFRRANFNNTMGAYQLFWAFCAVRKKRLMQAYGMWKFIIEMMRREEEGGGGGEVQGQEQQGGGEGDRAHSRSRSSSKESQSAEQFQSMKKQCMEARFFARASQHKIKALETKLNSVHNDKYLKEVVMARAKTEVSQELTAAVVRAEVAEALVKQLEEEMMGLAAPTPALTPAPPPPPRRGSRRLSVGDEAPHLQKERRKLACMQLLVRTAAGRAKEASLRQSKAFYHWRFVGSGSSGGSGGGNRDSRNSGRIVKVKVKEKERAKEMAEYEDKTVDTAARAIMSVVEEEVQQEQEGVRQLREEVSQLQRRVAAGRAGTLWATLAGCWRTHWRRRVCQAWSLWKKKSAAAHTHEDNEVGEGGRRGDLKQELQGDNSEKKVSEKLLLEAEKKFDELKKKSDVYQSSVKAHWTKTELYMTKLKSMVSEEKQKRKELKAERTALTSEIGALKVQLEASKKERSQLDYETVKRMMHVQKTLSGDGHSRDSHADSDGDSDGGSGASRYARLPRSTLASLGALVATGGDGGSPRRGARPLSLGGGLQRTLSLGLPSSRSPGGMSSPSASPQRLSYGRRSQDGWASQQQQQTPPPPSRPPRPRSNSNSLPASPLKLGGVGASVTASTDTASTGTQTDDLIQPQPLPQAQPESQPESQESSTFVGVNSSGGDGNTEVGAEVVVVPEKDPTGEGRTGALDYSDESESAASQWEALYSQAQEQLASESYAKEEAERALGFVQQQLAALMAEDATERDLISQLVQAAEQSLHTSREQAREQKDVLLALEERHEQVVQQERTKAAAAMEEKATSSGKKGGEAPARRGSLIARRNSLSSPGGSMSMEAAAGAAVSSLADGSSSGGGSGGGGRSGKSSKGRKQTYLLSNANGEGDVEASSDGSKRATNSIAFSSNITQLNFGHREDGLQGNSDDESDDSDANVDTDKNDVEMPVLPDMNFSAILEEMEEEESEALKKQEQLRLREASPSPSSSGQSKNKALEAAMNAKIPKSKPSSSSAKVTAATTTATAAISSSTRAVNDDDPMDYVWQYISQQKENPSVSDGSSNVRVAIRMRPLNQREVDLHAQQCVQMTSGTDMMIADEETTIENKFSFDYCFDAKCSDASQSFAGNQQHVFDKLGLEVLTNAWNGYNASLFAYGQTGSGKSYSMMGSDADPGIIPRVCMALFYLIQRHYETVEGEIQAGSKAEPSDRQFSVEASYLEIYNERIRDLLDPSRANLRVREHPQTGVFVENLSTCAVESYKDVSDLLEMGLQQRTTAATNMNSESSRSHSVFTIVIRMQSLLANGKQAVRLCKLCLVDLAGSERAASTGATGARLKEGANINKSLSTLGRCISALAKAASTERDGEKINIPFRESVLTWLLRESLCGNAKTAMLATVSPANVNYGETISTLRYANSAKMIATKAVVNEDPTTKIINELRNEVMRLREELSGAPPSQASTSTSGGGGGPRGGGGSDGGASSKKLKEKMKEHLLMAENALQTYAKAWESKEESMKNVKSKLQRRRAGGVVTSFGVGGPLSPDQVSRTPYLVSLSGDPLLHLAVKVFIPAASTLRIGRGGQEQQEQGQREDNDLQLGGLGIEPRHCSVRHCEDSGRVLLLVAPGAVTYVNGSQVGEGEARTEEEGRVGEGGGGSVVLRGGDRVVLGVCSHVFAFIDPRCALQDLAPLSSNSSISGGAGGRILAVTDCSDTDTPLPSSSSSSGGGEGGFSEVKSSIAAQESLSSHDQAVREVILGRVETRHEKEVRLATMLSNLWVGPARRRLFEDRLVEALKAVREASSISADMCTTSGVFFETTLGSTVDAAALHSLKIRDLFAYSNITIRVRCCCLVSPYDFPPSSSPALPGSAGVGMGLGVNAPGVSGILPHPSLAEAGAGTTGGGGNAQRIARHSRAGSQRGGGGGLLPSIGQVQQLRQVQFQTQAQTQADTAQSGGESSDSRDWEMERLAGGSEGGGGEGEGRARERRRPSLSRQKSNASQLLAQWGAEEAELLFEANLHDFEDGMGLLRGLHGATAGLRACLLQLRKHPLHSSSSQVAGGGRGGGGGGGGGGGVLADALASAAYPPPLVHLLAAAAQVIEAVLGAGRVDALLRGVREGFAADTTSASASRFASEEEMKCEGALAAVVTGVGEALIHLELEAELLQEMFKYYCVQYKEEQEQKRKQASCDQFWEGCMREGSSGEEGQEQELVWVLALLDALEACLHEGVVDCFSSPSLLTHPLPLEDDDSPGHTLTAEKGQGQEQEKKQGQGKQWGAQSSPQHRRAESSSREGGSPEPDATSLSTSFTLSPEQDEDGSSRLSARYSCSYSEQETALLAQQASLLTLTEALRGVTAKKESLFSLRAEDVQEDYEEDPYAYHADYSYDYSQQSQGEGSFEQYTEEEKQLWTEEERELYEWQQQHQSQQQQHGEGEEHQGGTSAGWDDASDWTQHYDESSQQYFYFSESLQESRWE